MGLITVEITTRETGLGYEKRYPDDMTIATLKEKVMTMTGIAPQWQLLELRGMDGSVSALLANDDATLGSYGIGDRARIHVKDTDPNATVAGLLDTTQIEKYEMSEEDYAKLPNSVRAFKAARGIGRFAPKENVSPEEAEAAAAEAAEEGAEAAAGMKVGDRCEVDGDSGKRGTVSYVGKASFKAGWWIGVTYDEPVGKNDGSVNGKRYFEAPAGYGGFVRPAKVEVGDFPEEDWDEL